MLEPGYLLLTPSDAADVKFIKKLADKKCKEKDQIVLDVKATNPHKHPIKWFKDGKPIPDSIRYSVLFKIPSQMVERWKTYPRWRQAYTV